MYAYSAAYKATYLVPEFIITGAGIYLLSKRSVLNIYMQTLVFQHSAWKEELNPDSLGSNVDVHSPSPYESDQ